MYVRPRSGQSTCQSLHIQINKIPYQPNHSCLCSTEPPSSFKNLGFAPNLGFTFQPILFVCLPGPGRTTMNQCGATTKKGNICSNKAFSAYGGYCKDHAAQPKQPSTNSDDCNASHKQQPQQQNEQH